MAEWTQCPSCQLKHVARPDGLCPRCRHPVAARPGVPAPAAWGSPPAPASPPAAGWGAGTAPPPAPQAPAADPWAAPQAAVAVPVAQPAPFAYAQAPSAFTVGGFLSGAFTTWARNAGWVLPLALVLYAPAAVAMYRAYSIIGAGAPSADADPLSFIVPLGAAIVLMVLLMPLELLAIARAGLRRLQGEPVELGDMLGVAARSYLPALALLLLVGLAYLGTFCTIVVPFILLSGWAASVPAMVAEGLGPIEAMKRSWGLTRGLRLQVFAGFLVVALAMLAITCVLQSISTILVMLVVSGPGGGSEHMGTSVAVMQASSMLLQGLQSSVYTTATAVAYHQLRVATEGPAASQLQRVFE